MDVQIKDDGQNIGQDIVYEQKIELGGIDMIYITNVTIKDKDLYDLLSIKQGGIERIEIFNQIIRAGTIGIMAIKGFTIAERVEKEFIHLQERFNNMLREHLGDKVEEYLGPSGRLENEIFNMDNPSSSLSKLKDLIERSPSKNEEIFNMLKIDSPDSPLYIIRREFTEKMADIGKELAVYTGRKEIYDKSTQKGTDFEDIVGYFLNNITANNFDNINRISRTPGKTGTKGDFLIEIYGMSEKINRKILVEVKENEEINIKKANNYLDECLQNWPITGFSILVYRDDPNGTLKGIRFEKDNRIICEFGNEGIILEAAYRIARIYLINEYKYKLELNRKDKGYRDIISGMSTYGISRVNVKIGIIETIQYINEILKIRNSLKKSFDDYSKNFDRSIIDMDEFRRNIGNKLNHLEKMLGPQEKNIEENTQKEITEDLSKEDISTDIWEDISTDISTISTDEDIPKSPKSTNIEDLWGS